MSACHNVLRIVTELIMTDISWGPLFPWFCHKCFCVVYILSYNMNQILSSHFSDKETGLERLYNMFKITKLASGRLKILIHSVCSHKLYFLAGPRLLDWDISDLESSQSDTDSSDLILNFPLPAPAAES